MSKITMFVQRRDRLSEINKHKVKPLVWNGLCYKMGLMISAYQSIQPRGPAGDKMVVSPSRGILW